MSLLPAVAVFIYWLSVCVSLRLNVVLETATVAQTTTEMVLALADVYMSEQL